MRLNDAPLRVVVTVRSPGRRDSNSWPARTAPTGLFSANPDIVRTRISSKGLGTCLLPRPRRPNTIARSCRICRVAAAAGAGEAPYRPADRMSSTVAAALRPLGSPAIPRSRRSARLSGYRGQPAIGRAGIEPDRPKFVMMRLAHLHPGHPKKDFARVEIAKNSALELKEKRRMNRVAEIQQRIRAGETAGEFLAGKANAAHLAQLMNVARQASGEAGNTNCRAHVRAAAAGISGCANSILPRIRRRRQKLEPDRVQPQPPQSQHPLQRHGKIAAPFRIFRRKAAAKKDGHMVRIAVLLFSSTGAGRSFDAPRIIR